MAWIESHQAIAHHPKTLKLARLLKVSVPAAIGHLHLLWWWSLDYAPDGWLGRYTADDIRGAMMWKGNAQALWDALRECGWLDAGLEGAEIHDWHVYAGRLIEQRKKDAERKRTSRGSPPDGPGTSSGQAADVGRTADVPYQPTVPTVPTQPWQPNQPARGPRSLDVALQAKHEEIMARRAGRPAKDIA